MHALLHEAGCLQLVSERVGARRLDVPRLRVRAERCRESDHELARDLAGEEHHADRADPQVLDRAGEVVADAVVDVDEVVVGDGEVVGSARLVVVGRVRTDEELPRIVAERRSPRRGVDHTEHPEPEVREPRDEWLDGVAHGRVRERLCAVDQPLCRTGELLADHHRAPEVARGEVGAAARRHRTRRWRQLVAERMLCIHFPHLRAQRCREHAERAVERQDLTAVPCLEILAQDAGEVRSEDPTLGAARVTRQAEHGAVGRDRLGRRLPAERGLGMVVPLHRGRDHPVAPVASLEHLQGRVVDPRVGAVGGAEPVFAGRDVHGRARPLVDRVCDGGSGLIGHVLVPVVVDVEGSIRSVVVVGRRHDHLEAPRLAARHELRRLFADPVRVVAEDHVEIARNHDHDLARTAVVDRHRRDADVVVDPPRIGVTVADCDPAVVPCRDGHAGVECIVSAGKARAEVVLAAVDEREHRARRGADPQPGIGSFWSLGSTIAVLRVQPIDRENRAHRREKGRHHERHEPTKSSHARRPTRGSDARQTLVR